MSRALTRFAVGHSRRFQTITGMNRSFRFIITLTSFLAVSVTVPATASAHQVPPTIITVAMSVAEHDMAVHTALLFTAAGLRLPTITVRRDADREKCQNHEGLHQAFGDTSLIDICTTDTGAVEARLMLHEMAHAWASHYLTYSHREAFRNVRHWKYWLDYKKAEWRYNGTEQAAEIIVWGLSEHPVQVAQLDHHSCRELHTAYVALTGLEPLHGYTDRCDDVATDHRS